MCCYRRCTAPFRITYRRYLTDTESSSLSRSALLSRTPDSPSPLTYTSAAFLRMCWTGVFAVCGQAGCWTTHTLQNTCCYIFGIFLTLIYEICRCLVVAALCMLCEDARGGSCRFLTSLACDSDNGALPRLNRISGSGRWCRSVIHCLSSR